MEILRSADQGILINHNQKGYMSLNFMPRFLTTGIYSVSDTMENTRELFL